MPFYLQSILAEFKAQSERVLLQQSSIHFLKNFSSVSLRTMDIFLVHQTHFHLECTHNLSVLDQTESYLSCNHYKQQVKRYIRFCKLRLKPHSVTHKIQYFPHSINGTALCRFSGLQHSNIYIHLTETGNKHGSTLQRFTEHLNVKP